MALPAVDTSSFRSPAVRLCGTMDYGMYQSFREQLDRALGEPLVVIALSTLGGDPEVARIMGEDVRFETEMTPQTRFVFLGKAAVYSAGATFMSFFARPNRYLARGARLMVHERQMTRTLTIGGPLTQCVASVQAVLNELTASIAIQEEGFENLIRGSSVSLDDVKRRAQANWYLEANEALALGLVEAVL